MDYKKYQYTILCEDKAHFDFVKGFLEKKGANTRKIRSYGKLPHTGSGKSFVLEHFSLSLKEYCSTASKTNTILIIVIDADNMDISEIMRNFSCGEQEKVFFVVAKWNIDSWFHFLTENPPIEADFETKSYKRQYERNTAHGKLGKKLLEEIETGKTLPPSLQQTYDSIKAKKQLLGL